MKYRFTAGGYDFHQERQDSSWQVVPAGDPPPRVGAYFDVKTLAKMKGVPLYLIPEAFR